MTGREELVSQLERLIEIRRIFIQDRSENFKSERLMTSLDSWIEDLDIQIDSLEDK